MEKVCCVCGADVARVKRFKDTTGNYYCGPCQQKKLAEIKPSAVTQARIRLMKICRSTGKLGCRLAPRTQSYLEFTRPRSTQSRAMPPRPFVSRTRSVSRGSAERDGSPRNLISASTWRSLSAYRSNRKIDVPNSDPGGKQTTCPFPAAMDSTLRLGFLAPSLSDARNGTSSSTSSQ